MKREKVMLELSQDEKSAVKANLHHIPNDTVLYSRLKRMNKKQRVSIYSDEYQDFAKFVLASMNDKNRYPNSQGKEWGSLKNVLEKLKLKI